MSDIEKKALPCKECDGEGIFERIIGGYIEPEYKEYECEDCDGTGQIACTICGDRPAFLTSADPMCESCEKEYEDELA